MSLSPFLSAAVRIGASAAAGTVVLGTALTGTAAAAPVTIEPLAGAEGFNAVARYDAALASTEMEGPLAAGGDLTLLGGYNIAAHTAGAFTAPGDAAPSALVVGGGVDWGASSGFARVQNGYVKIGDLSGTDVLTEDANQAARTTRAVPAGAGYDADARVETTEQQPGESVGAETGFDFEALFAQFEERSAALASCTGANVLNISGEDLNGVAEFTFPAAPSADEVYLINVDTTGTGGVFDWSTPNFPGISGANAPFVLWNFPDATEVTLTGGDSLQGSVYAPGAAFTDASSSNLEGTVVAASLHLGTAAASGGELHQQPFAGSFACEAGEEEEEGGGWNPEAPASETPSQDGSDEALPSTGTSSILPVSLAALTLAAGAAALWAARTRRAQDG